MWNFVISQLKEHVVGCAFVPAKSCCPCLHTYLFQGNHEIIFVNRKTQPASTKSGKECR